MSREEAEGLMADIERTLSEVITASLDDSGTVRTRGKVKVFGYAVTLLLRRERRMIRVLKAEEFSSVLDAWHAFLPSQVSTHTERTPML
ncbi:MAG: hypothetical protein H0W02_10250 [Ktedonobacteraceae bacterium]|nr:hypothetical protein [Ktedonobacteraceae bacterium]